MLFSLLWIQKDVCLNFKVPRGCAGKFTKTPNIYQFCKLFWLENTNKLRYQKDKPLIDLLVKKAHRINNI